MTRRPHRLVPGPVTAHAAVALLAFATLPGCGLFRPTEPEPPSGSFVVVDYTSPEKTLQTLELAIADKGVTNGLSAYVNGLAEATRDPEGFEAFHLSGVIQRYQSGGGTVPPSWTLGLESSFYSNFVRFLGDPYLMRWTPDERNAGLEFTDATADTASLYREYLVLGILEDQTTVTLARGFAYLRFIKGAEGRWVIARWKDIPGEPGDSEDETFGALRLELQ